VVAKRRRRVRKSASNIERSRKTHVPTTAWIALGSNLGDRGRNIDAAVAALAGVERVSRLRETDPVGGPAGQGRYLNGVAQIATEFSAREVLQRLHAIEADLGRVRNVKDGPRTIDLDLLAFGNQVVDESHLIVPHPRLQDRLFVLEPLAEIAAEWRHPVFEKSAAELLTSLRARQERLSTANSGRDLAGLRAMVTGSTSGIGRAMALALARAGADVIIHGRQSCDAAETTAAQCRGFGIRSCVMMADCGDTAACAELVDAAWREWEGLDIWIHNAGADTLTGAGAKASFADKLQTLLDVDVRGTIVATRRVGHWMKQRGQGSIVTIGWDQAETGMDGDSGQLFAAAKGAVMAFAKSLSLSLAPEVRVNVIAPGWIRTAWGETASAAWQERVRRETPLGTWGTPDDVAATARWLVSPAARFISGQTIRVNGGAVRG
jgi:3-oxoacyl-[acyl-carrier protein] reductase